MAFFSILLMFKANWADGKAMTAQFGAWLEELR
jgi:hypothetical protein